MKGSVTGGRLFMSLSHANAPLAEASMVWICSYSYGVTFVSSLARAGVVPADIYFRPISGSEPVRS